jgi:hypothetical protein
MQHRHYTHYTRWLSRDGQPIDLPAESLDYVGRRAGALTCVAMTTQTYACAEDAAAELSRLANGRRKVQP